MGRAQWVNWVYYWVVFSLKFGSKMNHQKIIKSSKVGLFIHRSHLSFWLGVLTIGLLSTFYNAIVHFNKENPNYSFVPIILFTVVLQIYLYSILLKSGKLKISAEGIIVSGNSIRWADVLKIKYYFGLVMNYVSIEYSDRGEKRKIISVLPYNISKREIEFLKNENEQ